MNQAFEKDCIEILAAKARRGEISRRRFAELAALFLGAGAQALRAGPALAADGDLVFATWGSDAGDAYDQAYGQPFQAATGIAVRPDGSGPTEGAIAAQFESGKPAWDIVDAEAFAAQSLGRQGMLEPIDYAVVDRSKMRPGFGWDYAASSYFVSYVIAWDTTLFADARPGGMADFFDVEKFPGKRSLYKWGVGMWEAALLADGVSPAALYPLDLDRAHAKLAAFKDNVAGYWSRGSESQAALADGKAAMALIWSSRARQAEQDSEGKLGFTWDQGLLSPGTMAVIKGNPGGRDAAMQFIASAQDPQKQLVMFDLLGQGPANPATDSLLPPEQTRFNPVDPANLALQIPLDVDWYAANYASALNDYLKVISA